MRGDRLKRIRERYGFSQRELATQCGIGEKQIWRYENEESDPTTEQLIKICKTLSVSADYLLGLVDHLDTLYAGGEIGDDQFKSINLIRKGDTDSIFEAIQLLSEFGRDVNLERETQLAVWSATTGINLPK